MSGLLLFATALNFFTTFGMLYFVYRIIRMKVTPPFTWSLKFWAVVIQVITMIWSIGFIWDINTFLQQFPPTTLIVSYTLGAIRSVLLFSFTAAVYYSLKGRFPPEL